MSNRIYISVYTLASIKSYSRVLKNVIYVLLTNIYKCRTDKCKIEKILCKYLWGMYLPNYKISKVLILIVI